MFTLTTPDEVQRWMNDNIKSEAEIKTREEIYQGIGKKICNDKVLFGEFLNRAIKTNLIVGFRWKVGRNGGCVPV